MSYTFLPWLRQGIAADLTAPTIDGGGLSGRLTVLVNDTEVADPGGSLRVRLLGPGDVTGFDQRLVLRTDPVNLARGVEPNYFPFVEFDEASFPWLFTPAVPDGTRLRPWLILVVVRQQEGVRFGVNPVNKIPVLTIEAPAVAANELPDLSESWAWAHVQVTGKAGGDELAWVLAHEPARSLARLLCPRRMRPLTAYHACVVPAFHDGVAAALGQPVGDRAAAGQDAWSLTDLKSQGGSARVVLPVFYRWDFTTGERGDFEALARSLAEAAGRPRTPEEEQALERVGRRRVDLSKLGFETPIDNPDPAVVDFEGLLTRDGPAAPTAVWFADVLVWLLQDEGIRTVRPPLYGGTQAGAGTVTGSGWLAELNLDPRYRAAAGLGAQVVREQQERLMEAAWAQAGDLRAVNQDRARSQLAREVGRTLWGQRLRPLADTTPGALLQLIAPARLPGGSVRAQLRQNGIAGTFVDPAFRRLTRPRGPIGRRFAPPPGGAPPAGTLPGLLPFSPGVKPVELVGQLNPDQTHAARAARSVRDPEPPRAASQADPLAPLVRPPQFPAPMVVELQRLGVDYVLPGAEHLPPEAALLIEPNRPFLAAFLAGLNHEMGRELLWREYPTDPAATYFRVFWDRRGYTPPAATVEDLADIRPIAVWQGGLGEQARPSPGGELVLVVRGQLLRRYPRAVVSAVKAAPGSPRRTLVDPPSPETMRRPLFTGFIDPDIVYFGFPLSEAAARGDDDGLGWFIVFQEQPSEPRFGLDESSGPAPAPPATSSGLAWGHLVPPGNPPEIFDALTHASVLNAPPANWEFPDTPGVRWTGGAADLAVLTRQYPARVAIHAAVLLPRG